MSGSFFNPRRNKPDAGEGTPVAAAIMGANLLNHFAALLVASEPYYAATLGTESSEALVSYAGAQDLYTVTGSPVRTVSERPDQAAHRAAHERILETLTTPGRVESGNEKPVDLLDD